MTIKSCLLIFVGITCWTCVLLAQTKQAVSRVPSGVKVHVAFDAITSLIQKGNIKKGKTTLSQFKRLIPKKVDPYYNEKTNTLEIHMYFGENWTEINQEKIVIPGIDVPREPYPWRPRWVMYAIFTKDTEVLSELKIEYWEGKFY